jgi:hypothetical protein
MSGIFLVERAFASMLITKTGRLFVHYLFVPLNSPRRRWWCSPPLFLRLRQRWQRTVQCRRRVIHCTGLQYMEKVRYCRVDFT